MRGALLDAAPRLKVVGRLGVGLDNIDVEACEARDIAVFPGDRRERRLGRRIRDRHRDDAAARRLRATGEVVAGAWPRNRLIGREIAGKRLGLVGFGAIARETAKRAVALGMSVAAYDPYVAPDSPAWDQPWGRIEPSSLEALLAGSDVVSLARAADARRRAISSEPLRSRA